MHRQGFSSVHRQGLQALCTQGPKLCAHKGSSSVHKRAQLCAHKGSSSVHRQGFSSVRRQGLQALYTRRRIPSSVHTRPKALCTQGLKLCAQKGSALCTGRGSKLCAQKAQSSVHKRPKALCTQGLKLCVQKAQSSVHTQEDSKLCAHAGGFRALCTGRGSKLCVQARVQALCTGKGSALCTHRRIPGSVHTRAQALCTKGSSSVHKRLKALCTKGFKLCVQKGSSSVHRQEFSSVHTRAQALCTKGFYLQKHTAFKLSDRSSLSSTVFYNPLPRHIHGKSNSFSASLGAKSILEKGLSTYFAESPLDFSVFLDFKSAKSTSVHREHLQKRLYPVFLPEPELPHLLQQSPSDCFCTVAGYNFALKSA